MLNQECLKAALQYCPLTGDFIWLKHNRNQTAKFTKAGSVNKDGYVRVIIKKKEYLAHRLAWLYVYGDWPEQMMDHINGNRADNRIANLRLVTPKQNAENRGRNLKNKSGYSGVVLDRASGKWRAQLKHNSKTLHLGLFETAEDAAAVVKEKRAQLFTHYVGRS